MTPEGPLFLSPCDEVSEHSAQQSQTLSRVQGLSGSRPQGKETGPWRKSPGSSLSWDEGESPSGWGDGEQFTLALKETGTPKSITSPALLELCDLTHLFPFLCLLCVSYSGKWGHWAVWLLISPEALGSSSSQMSCGAGVNLGGKSIPLGALKAI